MNGDHIKIGIKAKPLRGEANREIVKKIAKQLGVSTTNVRILAGEKSREKLVEVI
jgi:uncharacterized protein (TIGR00251 family)